MQYTSKEVYEYVSKKANDPIVEWKKCRLSGQEFPIYQSDLEFYDKVSPIFEMGENDAKEFFEKNSDVKDNFEYKDGKLKAKLTSPTLCPEERERMRFAFRNEKSLYKGKCSATGKSIISIFSPDKRYTIYDYSIRWEGMWNSENYALGLNLKFNESFSDLISHVPMRNKFSLNNINSEYVNVVGDSKDCYMSFASIGVDSCIYARECCYSTNCIDCFFAVNSEHCYDCVQVNNSFNLYHCTNCTNCSDSQYLLNCDNCHDCFNCYNLENKSFCIDNVQYTKEEYMEYPKKKSDISDKYFVIGCNQQGCENSFGNNLTNCKKCGFVSDTVDSIGTKYTRYELNAVDCMDTFTSLNNTCIYMISCPNSYACGCTFYGRSLKFTWYCCNCYNCSYCFGCVGLQNKEYCIYNKQYSKGEYNKLVPEIIAQMIRDGQRGEFFDPQLSYFGYNETIAMEFYPITKEEAIKMGYKRSDYESPAPKVEKIVEGSKLPKQGCKIIQEKKPEILEKIVNYAVVCEVSRKPFRITKQEIDFYIKHNLPLPTKHPDVRHQERLARKDPTVMHLVHCDECGEEMLSVHLPGEGKRVLCEKCYNSEI